MSDCHDCSCHISPPCGQCETYGHGGIKLTAYMPSQRVGVEVTADNAVMDWSELFEFVDKIRKPGLDDATVERAAVALYVHNNPVGNWSAHSARVKTPYRDAARAVLAAAVEAGHE